MATNLQKNTPDTNTGTLAPAILELVASRICHDLISPVGAVHNGVEFLEEMGAEAGQDAISLIAHSAQQAAAKLGAFRLAYGAGGRDPNIKPKDVKKIFEDLIEADGKVRQDWDAYELLSSEEPPIGFCKILTGVLMIAQESLPKGGEISVKNDNGVILVKANGPDAAARSQVDAALAQTLSLDDLDPRLVHPYAISVLAKQYGFDIALHAQENETVTYAITHSTPL